VDDWEQDIADPGNIMSPLNYFRIKALLRNLIAFNYMMKTATTCTSTYTRKTWYRKFVNMLQILNTTACMSKKFECISATIITYYPTAANTVQITVQMYSDIAVICTVENLFAGQVGTRTQNCHTLPLSLINLLTTAVG